MKRKFLLNKLGVSLMEVMVVIVIIGITLLIWKFSSKGHVKLAIVNEGRMFVEKVVAQEKMYRARTGGFKAISNSNNDIDIMINTHDNKYFKTFNVALTSSGAGINVTVQGSGKAQGINITGAYAASDNSLSITESGL